MGQGTVVRPGDCGAALLQSDGVVAGCLHGKTHGALGEAGAVVEDGALQPVVAAVAVVACAVAFVVLEQRRAGGAFAGVPVAGAAGQALAVDETFGLILLAGAFEAERDVVLALGVGLGHGGEGGDG
ncbi:hypothetical protein D3C79_772120 [compost metagenome]